MCDRVDSMRVKSIIKRECQMNARRMLQKWGCAHEWLDPSMERKCQLWSFDSNAWLTSRRRVVIVGDWFEYLQRRRARYCQLKGLGR